MNDTKNEMSRAAPRGTIWYHTMVPRGALEGGCGSGHGEFYCLCQSVATNGRDYDANLTGAGN